MPLLNFIDYPDACLHSPFDECLEVCVSSNNLFLEDPVREKAQIRVIGIADFGDTLTIAGMTYTFGDFQEQEGIIVGTDIDSQIQNIIQKLSSNPSLLEYNIYVNPENDTVICIEAVNEGVNDVTLNIDTTSDTITINTYQQGSDGRLRNNYKVNYYLYQVKNGHTLLLQKLNGVRPIINEHGENKFTVALQGILQKLFTCTPIEDNGFVVLKDATCCIEVRASYSWRLANGRTIESDIQPSGIRFQIINAVNNACWHSSLSYICNCDYGDIIPTKFMTYMPSHYIHLSACIRQSLYSFLCVPKGTTLTGSWCANLVLQDGTIYNNLVLSEFELLESSVVGYNAYIQEDNVFAPLLPSDNPCSNTIDYIEYFVKTNILGNPLDFTMQCFLNDFEPSEPSRALIFQTNFSNEFLPTLTYEWSYTTSLTSPWQSFGGNNSQATLFTGQYSTFNGFVRLVVTLPDNCELITIKPLNFGTCLIKAGFNLTAASIEEPDYCADFSQTVVFGQVVLDTVNRTWSLATSIASIVSEILLLGGTNILIQHHLNDNHTVLANNSIMNLDYAESVTVVVKVSFEYNGHCIIRELSQVVNVPAQDAVINLAISCIDQSAGVVGQSFTIIDNSLGGSQITGNNFFVGYGANTDSFEEFELQIFPQLVTPVTPLAPFDILYSDIINECLYVVQVLKGCDDEVRVAYRKICFDCGDACADLDFSIATTNAPCDAKVGTANITDIVGNVGGYSITVTSTDFNIIMAAVSSTPTDPAPAIVGLELSPNVYTVTVESGGCVKKKNFTIVKQCACQSPSDTVATADRQGGVNLRFNAQSISQNFEVQYRPAAGNALSWQDYLTPTINIGDNDEVDLYIDPNILLGCTVYVIRVRSVCGIDSDGNILYSDWKTSAPVDVFCCDPCEPSDCEPCSEECENDYELVLVEQNCVGDIADVVAHVLCDGQLYTGGDVSYQIITALGEVITDFTGNGIIHFTLNSNQLPATLVVTNMSGINPNCYSTIGTISLTPCSFLPDCIDPQIYSNVTVVREIPPVITKKVCITVTDGTLPMNYTFGITKPTGCDVSVGLVSGVDSTDLTGTITQYGTICRAFQYDQNVCSGLLFINFNIQSVVGGCSTDLDIPLEDDTPQDPPNEIGCLSIPLYHQLSSSYSLRMTLPDGNYWLDFSFLGGAAARVTIFRSGAVILARSPYIGIAETGNSCSNMQDTEGFWSNINSKASAIDPYEYSVADLGMVATLTTFADFWSIYYTYTGDVSDGYNNSLSQTDIMRGSGRLYFSHQASDGDLIVLVTLKDGSCPVQMYMNLKCLGCCEEAMTVTPTSPNCFTATASDGAIYFNENYDVDVNGTEMCLTDCHVSQDVMIVMDRTGSVSTIRNNIKGAVSQLIQLVRVDETANNIGLISFASTPTLEAPLGSTESDLLTPLDTMVFGGSTYANTAIEMATAQLTGGTATEKIMIFISDGRMSGGGTNAWTQEIDAFQQAHNAGIRIITLQYNQGFSLADNFMSVQSAWLDGNDGTGNKPNDYYAVADENIQDLVVNLLAYSNVVNHFTHVCCDAELIQLVYCNNECTLDLTVELRDCKILVVTTTGQLPYEYQITDANGVVTNGTLTAPTSEIDVSELPAGSYTVTIIDSNNCAQSYPFELDGCCCDDPIDIEICPEVCTPEIEVTNCDDIPMISVENCACNLIEKLAINETVDAGGTNFTVNILDLGSNMYRIAMQTSSSLFTNFTSIPSWLDCGGNGFIEVMFTPVVGLPVTIKFYSSQISNVVVGNTQIVWDADFSAVSGNEVCASEVNGALSDNETIVMSNVGVSGLLSVEFVACFEYVN